MNRVPGIFAAVCIAGLMTLTAFQGDKIDNITDILKTTSNELEMVKIEKQSLEEEVLRLQDEIERLEMKVADLEGEINEYKERLMNLRGQIKKLKTKLKTLNTVIEQAKEKGVHSENRIRQLELEKSKLEQEITYHLQKEETLLSVQEETNVQIANTLKETEALNELREFIAEIQVDYQAVELRKEKEEGRIKRIKKKDNAWKYTAINFSLEHPNQALLFEQEFVLKVLDLDSGKILPFNENNPQYPNSSLGTNGYLFSYNENLAEVLYYNNEEKEGQNYEVRLFIKFNGKDVPLTDSKLSIVKHGKAVKLN